MQKLIKKIEDLDKLLHYLGEKCGVPVLLIVAAIVAFYGVQAIEAHQLTDALIATAAVIVFVVLAFIE